MPIQEPEVSFTTYKAPEVAQEPTPGWSDLFSASFNMENDVVNAVEALNAPTFKRDPQFDWIKKLQESPYWDDYRDNFVGTRNEEEYNYRISQIEQERKDRETLERGGFAGFVTSMAAGSLSPTMLLPFAGQGKGLKFVGEALAFGFAGGVLQELPLMANQRTRTLEEMAISIGASTILSGTLGGAVAMLKRGEFDALSEQLAGGIRHDADVDRGSISIRTQSAGAATSIPEHAGPLASGGNAAIKVLDSNAVTRSPVTSNLNGESPQGSFLMAQYADAGLSMRGNELGIPTTPGGTIENAVKLHNRKFEEAVRSIDSEYNNYFFNNKPPKILAGARATVGGHFSKEFMDKTTFRKEVGKAMFSGDEHENEFVRKVVNEVRKKVFDPMLKEAQEVGLMAKEIKLLADPTYLNRLYDHDTIRGGRKNEQGQKFEDVLKQEFETKLQADFAERLAKLEESQLHRSELLEDVQRAEEEVEELRKTFLEELKAINENAPENVLEREDEIAGLRAQARELKDKPGLDNAAARKQFLADARSLEKAWDDWQWYRDRKTRRTQLRRRLGNLNKSQVLLEKKHARKLEKIERAEELSVNSLMRVARAGKRILNKLDDWTDEELDKQLSKFKSQFADTAQMYDKAEEKIAKLSDEDQELNEMIGPQGPEPTDINPMATAEQRQLARKEKLNALAGSIADIEDTSNREIVRDTANAVLHETMSRVQEITGRRAVRTERLRPQAKKIEPQKIEERIKGIVDEGEVRTAKFNEGIRTLGADSIDMVGKTADFSRFAEESAIAIRNKIEGTFVRLPTVDVLQDKRGATLARVLDIPSSKLLPWLETDIEKLVRSHVMTMAPDIEIARKFQGSVNTDEILAPMWDEMEAKIKAVDTEMKGRKVDKDGKVLKEGTPLTPVEKENRTAAIKDQYQLYKTNLLAVHERLRHSYGLPTDPNGIGYRLGNVVANLNVLRYMGMVTVSSLPDVAAPIMKYGLTRVFRDALVPMITNFKAFKMSAREVKYAGVGNDTILNLRAQTILDITDNLGRGSKFERGVNYLTSRQGLVAGFNIWTDAMKQFTGVVANGKLMDSIARSIATDDVKAGKFLAEVGIGKAEAVRIWDQALKVGAATKQNGVWLPNTEAWTDEAATRFYRTALAREVDRTIITPGVERPLWTNATQTGRLVSQFKSFALASTYRTTMAGLQQRDAAFVNGVMVSLGMGAMSYYLYAMAAGGKAYEDMQNADIERWADEAYQRSGILAVFGLGQDLLSRVPLTSEYSSLSGARTTRRGGDDLLETILGPTYGDFAPRVSDVVTGLDDPTQSTAHTFRTLLPWQNLVWFRQLLDQIGDANPLNLPERRGQ